MCINIVWIFKMSGFYGLKVSKTIVEFAFLVVDCWFTNVKVNIHFFIFFVIGIAWA